jgi:DNA-directed RNA polymerase specialized sigma24 family protein
MDVLVEALPNWRGYLYTVAHSILPHGHPGVDDLAQEGLIAMWRAVGDHDPARAPLAAYARWRAVNRMRDVASQRSQPTGHDKAADVRRVPAGAEARDRIRAHLRAHPGATGRQIAAAVGLSAATVSYHRKRLHLDGEVLNDTSLDALLDEGFDPAAAGDVLDVIIEGYMAGEVCEALAVLTPAERKYVVLRFWHGAQQAELTAAFGYEPHGLWRTAKERLRPVLADLMA